MSQPDPRPSIAPPLDAERIISSQLLDHGVIAARGSVIPDQCRVYGRLTGQCIFERRRGSSATGWCRLGMMAMDEPRG